MGGRSVMFESKPGDEFVEENRLIEIETKLAHQEHLLSQLNDALTDQQAQLIQVIELCQNLIERMRSASEQGDAPNPADERPPHY